MPANNRHPLLTGTAVTSLGTLASRILGLVRDTATAALFGLATGGVLDALFLAFRIPNLFRALFGEGALTASYMPVLTQALEEDRERTGFKTSAQGVAGVGGAAETPVVATGASLRSSPGHPLIGFETGSSAARLFAAVTRWLIKLLVAITLAGEIGLAVWAWLARDNPQGLLLAGLSAAMLPLLVLVCAAAVDSATLQALGKFGPPAFAPAALNVCWIVGAWLIAPKISTNPAVQAYVMAACILLGGAAQWMVQWPALRRAGFGWRVSDEDSETIDRLRQIRRGMLPVMLALTVTQLNTLSDSLVAWLLAAPPGSSQTIGWLGGVQYPMQRGAVSAIYFGERLYQFPLGLIGIAAATVVFPLLAKHASRSNLAAVASDLTLGLRLVLLLAVPSAVGLVIFAEPIARLMFQHGNFTAADTARTARMIAVYGSGVWAYCALPMLVRGFYAMNDRVRPLRAALVAVALNLVLDFSLIWPFAESGLALATAISATLQAIALAIWFSRCHVQLLWRKLAATVILAAAAAAAMAAIGLWVLHAIPESPGIWNAIWRVAAPLSACLAVYGGLIAIFARAEWQELFGGASE